MHNRKYCCLSFLLAFIFCFFIIVWTPHALGANVEDAPPSLSATASVLYEAKSDTLLFSKDHLRRLPMASTTKIITALAALDALDINAMVSFPKTAVGVEGSSAYFTEDEVLSVRDLLYALLLQSANDAAEAIAILADGSCERFAERMNRLVASYGCTDTHLVNPHGLFHEDHYTTAYDLAIIADHLLSEPTLAEIVKTKVYTAHTSCGRRVFVNHNKLLSRYEGAIGVKTGFTKKSGRCLVGATEVNGMTLISVTLNAPSDWTDHEKLWEYASRHYEYRTLLSPRAYRGQLLLGGSYAPFVFIENRASVEALIKKDFLPIEESVSALPYVLMPPNADAEVGRIVFKQNGSEVGSAALYICKK